MSEIIVSKGSTIIGVEDVDKYSDTDMITYDIDTTHVCIYCGVFDFGEFKVSIPKSLAANPDTWIKFDSRSYCPHCYTCSQYMYHGVFQCDREIAHDIFLLNKSGIKTGACCASHIYYSREHCWKDDGFYVLFSNDKYIKMISEYVSQNCDTLKMDDLVVRSIDTAGCLSYEEAQSRRSMVLTEFHELVKYFVGAAQYQKDTKIYPHSYCKEQDTEESHGIINLSSICRNCGYISVNSGVTYMNKINLKNYFIFDILHYKCEKCNGDLVPIDLLMVSLFSPPFKHIRLHEIANPFILYKDSMEETMRVSMPVFSIRVDYNGNIEELLQNEVDQIPNIYWHVTDREIRISIHPPIILTEGGYIEYMSIFGWKSKTLFFSDQFNADHVDEELIQPLRAFLVSLDHNIERKELKKNE